MKDYSKLDKAVLTAIKNGRNTFASINNGKIAAMCDELRTHRSDGFRVLDRRLQALKNAGKISYTNHGGWRSTYA